MVKRQISLKQLQRAVAIERERIRKAQERSRLESELRQLRGSRMDDAKSRIGRGFKILTRKARVAAMKQARLIRERQIQESKKPKRKGGGVFRDSFAPSSSLDF